MHVWIKRLELTDFRNYESFVLEPAEGLTVLLGPNAVGKTNVIEAIELVTETSSFRNPAWSDLVRAGADRAVVSMRAESEAGSRTDIVLAVENGRRAYRVNGTAKRSVIDAAGQVPAVVFTPDDLRIIKEASDRRRGAVDSVGTQVSRAYAQLKTEYDRVLRQRNALLREGEVDDGEIAPWTEQLVRAGAALATRRRRLTDTMAGHLTKEYEALSGGEDLRVSYVSTWRPQTRGLDAYDAHGAANADDQEAEEAAAMAEVLVARRGEERARRTSLVGPHRDDLRFEVEAKDARTFASQGQQRSIALAWKLAELEVIEELTGTTPVLLLDDVMSELDESRRHALSARVSQRTQTVMTTTNLGYFDEALIAEAKVVELA